MTRNQLEHLIRSASAITNSYEVMVVGSQSILGSYPFAPPELLQSMEADLYLFDAPNEQTSDLIDGSIGEDSHFHTSFGYYAQGVSPTTSVLPSDWRTRVSRIDLPSSVGYCLDVHDLAISKMIANRPKDHDFVSVLFQNQMLDVPLLHTLIPKTPHSIDDPRRHERLTLLIQRLNTHPPSPQSRHKP